MILSVKDSSNNVLDFSKNLTKQAEEVTSSSEEIAKVMDKISKGVLKQASEIDKAFGVAVEEVNTSVATQLNDIQNVKSQADELYNLAQTLKGLIEKFEV